MRSLTRIFLIAGVTLILAGCGLFDAVFAKPLDTSGCDRTIEEFYRTGTVTCGHVTWQLHPAHARRLKGDIFGYFRKYESMYLALRDITGHEPHKPVRILEQCPKGTPFWEDCPHANLDLQNPMFVRHDSPLQPFLKGLHDTTSWIPVWTVYDPTYVTIYATREFFEYVLPRLVADRRQPVWPSLGHEFGHVFGPSSDGIYPYMWDKTFVESFASLWGVDLYLIHQNLAGVSEYYYSDGYCRDLYGFDNWNCDTYFTFSEFAAPRKNQEFEEFKKNKPTGKDLYPHTVMLLAEVYRQFYREGRGEDYYQGMRKTLHYYHRDFHAPDHWEHTGIRSGSETTIREKVSLFVYLLSVYSHEDLTPQFQQWGFPVNAHIQSWFMATRRQEYDEKTIRYYADKIANGW